MPNLIKVYIYVRAERGLQPGDKYSERDFANYRELRWLVLYSLHDGRGLACKLIDIVTDEEIVSNPSLPTISVRKGGIQFTLPKEKPMDKEQTISALAAEIARLRALPDEPMTDNGDGVVFFTKKFIRSDVEYRYCAVRVPALDRWFITAGAGSVENGRGYTWEALLEHIKHRASEYEIWWASAWDRIDA